MARRPGVRWPIRLHFEDVSHRLKPAQTVVDSRDTGHAQPSEWCPPCGAAVYRLGQRWLYEAFFRSLRFVLPIWRHSHVHSTSRMVSVPTAYAAVLGKLTLTRMVSLWEASRSVDPSVIVQQM